MNEIIKVNDEHQTISARDLHENLEIGTRFNDWFTRILEFGFEEGKDFYSKMSKTNSGGRPSTDYEISIDMAKHICMVQRTEKAKQVRQYLIDLEKAWNTPEQVMARALRIADQTIANLHKQIEIDKPKVEFFDTVADSKTAIPMNEVAKVLAFDGIGRNKLFEFLRNQSVLMQNNVPYQRYIDNGWFRVVENKYQNKYNEPVITTKTLVFQKGVDGIRKLLVKAGVGQ